MGAVNYSTSNYITLGVKPYDVEGYDNDYVQELYESDRTNIECELDRHSFYYYDITIVPGYYEGFTLNITNNYIVYDNWEDRQAADKEVTEIKKLLIECAGLGLVECSPGWCTGYSGYKGTIKAIGAAIKEMRKEIKNIPTYNQYLKGVCYNG